MANLDALLKKLDEAFLKGDIEEINRVNKEIYSSLGDVVSTSSLDYSLINNIKGKPVYKNLVKLIREGMDNKEEVVKLLSSLITHMVIECQLSNKELKTYPIKILMNSINTLIYEDGEIEDVRRFLQEKYERYL